MSLRTIEGLYQSAQAGHEIKYSNEVEALNPLIPGWDRDNI